MCPLELPGFWHPDSHLNISETPQSQTFWKKKFKPCQDTVQVSFLSLWQNTWGKQLKRKKYLFRLMGLELSVHGHLALLFLSLWWSRELWQKGMVEEGCSLHGGRKAEQGKEEGAGTKCTLQEHPASDSPPPSRPYLLKSLPPPWSSESISGLMQLIHLNKLTRRSEPFWSKGPTSDHCDIRGQAFNIWAPRGYFRFIP
jgi:hypothetical protein